MAVALMAFMMIHFLSTILPLLKNVQHGQIQDTVRIKVLILLFYLKTLFYRFPGLYHHHLSLDNELYF